MGLAYLHTLTPKATPTDRQIWQSRGVSGYGINPDRWIVRSLLNCMKQAEFDRRDKEGH